MYIYACIYTYGSANGKQYGKEEFAAYEVCDPLHHWAYLLHSLSEHNPAGSVKQIACKLGPRPIWREIEQFLCMFFFTCVASLVLFSCILVCMHVCMHTWPVFQAKYRKPKFTLGLFLSYAFPLPNPDIKRKS